MRMFGLGAVLALAVVFDATAVAAQQVRIYTSQDPMLRLRTLSYQGGRTIEMSVGIGSGAFRAPTDPPNIFWTIGDRGPNFTSAQAEGVTGYAGARICGVVRNCRIYLAPDYAPSIYRIEVLADGTFRVLDVIALKTRSGVPVTGLLNPLTVASTENAVDGAGRPLAHDPNAVDAEGIVRLADGTFWIGDENGPSIIHVAADGRIQRRLVPAGTEGDYRGADYEVLGALPAILARRQINRGIESMAVSRDERHLYFIMQNPLANPDAAAFRDARAARIVRIDRQTLRPTGQWVYMMDPTANYRGEAQAPASEVRISELLWIGENRFLVDERTERTTKIFEIDLTGATDILGGRWDDPATRPTLEQSAIEATGITPVRKTLRFDTADHPNIPTKIEGLALFGDGALMMINDDDFGIEGNRTQVIRIEGLPIGR